MVLVSGTFFKCKVRKPEEYRYDVERVEYKIEKLQLNN